MKTRRFLSVFLMLALLVSTCIVPAHALEDPDIQAGAALLMDANTGAVVYAENEHKEMYPASLTKIMTAMLVLEAVEDGKLTLDHPITVTESSMEGLSADGSSANIKAGETWTVEELLYCMMVISANEACNILAEAVSGDVQSFVDEMNARASALGCENTHFVNPHGLHDDQHYTSAWDLYLITRAAMEVEHFMDIADNGDITLPATEGHGEMALHSTNYLISVWRSRGYVNKDAHGIKTGHTDEAGYCLVSSATKGSLSFISVMLDCERLTLEGGEIRTMTFYETNRIFDWAFNNFGYQTVLESTEQLKEVDVALSRQVNYVTVHPAQDVEVLMPNDLTAADLERDITLKAEPVDVPIQQGEVLGSVTLRHDGKEYATVDLLANSSAEASKLLIFWRDVQEFFSKTAVKVALIVLAVLILAFIIWRITMSRRRYRYGRSVSWSRRRNDRGRRR